ncbi:ribonuclease HI family protein [Candidatus Woesearchaeota archaeon]|nr:ribonuclease HI family protein [Candidatus Woesearchaeota archaeon]
METQQKQMSLREKPEDWDPRRSKVILYTDGASRNNPGNAAIGYRIATEDGAVLKEHKAAIGIKTNNEAEYHALIAGLEEASTFTREEVVCCSDSQLVVAQMDGAWRIKKPHLKALHREAKLRESAFKKVTYTHLPREHKQIAACDNLANEALDGK